MFKFLTRASTKITPSPRRTYPWSGRITVLVAACLVLAGALAGGMLFATSNAGAATAHVAPAMSSSSPNTLVPVVVRDDPTFVAGSEQLLMALGGHITRQIGIINGYAALIPQGAIDSMRQTPGVASVTLDEKLQMTTSAWDTMASQAGTPDLAGISSNPNLPGWKSGSTYNTMNAVTKLIGAQDLWADNATGNGVGIALID
jgi:hypothetical protein